MRRAIAFLCLALSCAPLALAAAPASITRLDGFVQIWDSIRRPAGDSHGYFFDDVPKGSRGSEQVLFALYRGVIDNDGDLFYPNEPLTAYQALLWIFRTRSVEEDGLFPEKGETMDPAVVTKIAMRMSLAEYLTGDGGDVSVSRRALSQDDLFAMMRRVDAILADEVHETSLYSEKFQGKGTAFGESFDMHDLTAAHRTFPYNTLVKVTNIANDKSVIVRINDRGPFVSKRDMDMSLASFLQIADRALGKINVRFQRLGDVNLVGIAGQCSADKGMQMRIAGRIRLTPGLPLVSRAGEPITLAANGPFVVLKVTYPDGTESWLQDWILASESYVLRPAVEGRYAFLVGTGDGRRRALVTNVVSCPS